MLKDYFRDWLNVIDKQELYKVVHNINVLYKNKSCEPEYNNIFKAFNITPYRDLKLISLAQDPYSQKGISTGVSFANKKDAIKLSPSLEVIKESVINFEIPHNFIIFDPTLEEVSKQGVLFLNSSLTVETNKPNSHTYLWRSFISSLLKNLSMYNPGLIYILWGNVAATFSNFISKNNTVYKMPHPAYYARNQIKIPYDFFREVNETVYKHFGERIEWFKTIY